MDQPSNYRDQEEQSPEQLHRQDVLYENLSANLWPVVECFEMIEERCPDDCPECHGQSAPMIIGVAFTREVIQN